MQSNLSLKGQNIIYDESLQNKDISDILAERFSDDPSILEKTLDDMYDPYLMKDMEKAVARIRKAKEQKEKVMIFGDYDVDGVSSTALVMHMLKKLGMQVSYRLPHRVEDGYGLKTKFVDEAIELGVSLLITVDCGSRDAEIVTDAKNKGLDIIVTDHHSVGEIMPDNAIAFVNPARKDCDYPFTGLAGVGVAYKLVCALAKLYFPEKQYREYMYECSDIAALGTVADCMMLVDENRIIVHQGLKQIKKSRSRGLRFLIEDKMSEELDGDIFGFLIGPRLNAAGRMDTPYKAVNLLLNNGDTLIDTIREIESLNELRKSKTTEFVSYALENVSPEKNIIFYDSPDIGHGIIGIVAGRLTEKYFRPSIVLIDEGEKLVASCRAPEYFSIIELLDEFKEYLLAYGGHKQAAGFSISKEKYPEFRSKIEKKLSEIDFSTHKRELYIDSVISCDQIGFGFLEKIQKFKPFGMGNPVPKFLIKNFEIESVKFLGKGRDHLRFQSRYGFKMFAFGMGEYYDDIRGQTSCDLICEIAEDNWQGQRGIMIRVIDIIL